MASSAVDILEQNSICVLFVLMENSMSFLVFYVHLFESLNSQEGHPAELLTLNIWIFNISNQQPKG